MTIDVPTNERVEILDVTDLVENEIPDGADGVATVFVQHTSAGIAINEAESRLLRDVEDALERLIPEDGGWAHDAIDDNADAHLRGMLLGSSVSVPVDDGDLGLGTWQSILLFEGDGPRTRTLRVSVVE